jgi:hypothetical protein
MWSATSDVPAPPKAEAAPGLKMADGVAPFPDISAAGGHQTARAGPLRCKNWRTATTSASRRFATLRRDPQRKLGGNMHETTVSPCGID